MTITTPKFTADNVLSLVNSHYNLLGTLKPLQGYCDQNYLLTTPDNERYIVKIANNAEPLSALEMQNAAMEHLVNRHCQVPNVINNNYNDAITKISATDTNANTSSVFNMRVLSYLTGDFYAQIESKTANGPLWSSLGQFIAQIDNSLADFTHPGAFRYLEWDLAQGYPICMSKKHLLTTSQAVLVDKFLMLYQTQTLPVIGQLPQGVIHNDANDHNVLVDSITTPTKVTGLIDFGDMVHTHIINDLAITCAYALMGQEHPLKALTAIVSAYHQVRPLSDLELEVLYSLVALRLCTTVCNAALAIKENPDNEYLNISVAPAWQLLTLLSTCNPFAVLCQLRTACGLPLDNGKSKNEIVNYRKKHLGKTLSLSYKEPLKIVRGQGAYLYNEYGTPYLDMVNNVCHVGHCHPKVVSAGQNQLAKLNTNTRYLHDNIVEYSEKLLATMPEKLSVCMLVNSGSEANELAFRLAQNFTGSKQLLTVDGAYHGNTSACIEASPYKFDGPGGKGAADYVHKVTLPDPYRGKYQGENTATDYANDVAQVIADIEAKGEQVGTFICESLQGVAGQIIMPEGYLTQVYQLVRNAGGVCIADEVQVGFGRVGTHMWAFETQNVVPDIVTLGKPIGNGHPMAAVITTQAIADAFVNGMEYFNTFGGNPVSCAIGNAVLDVIKQERLQENALTVGHYLLNRFKTLQEEYSIIGDVRGLGLFIGVELVTDRETKTPATDETGKLVEFAKAHQVLLSTEGRFYNILKIKPPIVFSKRDADIFVNVIEQGLKQLNINSN
ncbi:aminotransferase class III-fold pyridoxal phosphate-dependent enzyme [Thalassotalea profundi]|uniref:Aminotransferase n=1 Tax=Thalassotalea profundi TaxID=2036687 RepID=A0ABQ3IL17_9GAMM|nr:aminotransferase class III-fold pyridoxal phosphate-dependent enzyme [Thalassotalea profundi]GHE86962.1 aminotransferase [Thalassotalea profundi]